MAIFVTGSAGFIGSDSVLDWVKQNDESAVNLEKPSYVGNLNNFAGLDGNLRHHFMVGDIVDSEVVARLLCERRNFLQRHIEGGCLSPRASGLGQDINSVAYRDWVGKHDADCRLGL